MVAVFQKKKNPFRVLLVEANMCCVLIHNVFPVFLAEANLCYFFLEAIFFEKHKICASKRNNMCFSWKQIIVSREAQLRCMKKNLQNLEKTERTLKRRKNHQNRENVYKKIRKTEERSAHDTWRRLD